MEEDVKITTAKRDELAKEVTALTAAFKKTKLKDLSPGQVHAVVTARNFLKAAFGQQ